MEKIKIIGIFILSIFLFFFLFGCEQNVQKTPIVKTSSFTDVVKIPLSEVTTQMKKHSFNGVNYFVVNDSLGTIRTAFDACDVCGGSLGYEQKGSDVRCKKCDRSFKITDLGIKNKGGGCWPSYLSHSIEGNNILIDKLELAKGTFRFN